MKFSRAGYLCLSAYLVISVLYTTKAFVIRILYAPGTSFRPTSDTPLRIAKETWEPDRPPSLHGPSSQPAIHDSNLIQTHVDAANGTRLGSWLGGSRGLDPGNDLLLSKAFATSMRPSDIVPYFLKSSGPFAEDEVTITSIVTSNRLDVFARLIDRYRGPISVTFHVNNDTQQVHKTLETLQAMYTSSATMMRYVDIHLVVDSFDRQFNTWRNIARLFARTNFVMMLDIDFYLCTDFRSTLRTNAWARRKLEEGLSAFVVPAFEYVDSREEHSFETFPVTKRELLSNIKAGKIDMFHAGWKPGHNSTDYSRFYSSKPGDVYKVTTYQSAYEPYIVFKKSGPPWCEERFVGYGGNKAACLFEMFLSGVDFYVLADHFIIHQQHLYEESARRTERKYNRKVYASFKEEACFRYLRSYRDTGLLNSTRAKNSISECRKLKAVRLSTAKVCRSFP
ncbi:glycosyl-transferase for dystroglycan-domain-containing protein [Coprinopsis sp. MPI-PUGE-AT-0042]|nr:glycosyl-transferase for dystroglycan-domain-containing protein [Coprinopsis sp. MPI-PUGE-AT-0042]